SVDFYVRAFGFEKTVVTNDASGMPNHAELRWKDALIMLGPETSSSRDKSPHVVGPTHVTHYVYVDDVDALYKRALEADAKGGGPHLPRARPRRPPVDVRHECRRSRRAAGEGSQRGEGSERGEVAPKRAAHPERAKRVEGLLTDLCLADLAVAVGVHHAVLARA